MNKFIIGLAVSLALTFSVQAQNHSKQSLFGAGVTSIVSSNLLQITNLSYAASTGTNFIGIIYTNAGVRTTVTGSADTKRLLVDAFLWADREGRAYSLTSSNTITQALFNTPASLAIKTISMSGANAAVTFVFSPVYNDDIGESTVTTDWFTASITPTASSTQTWNVPVPVYKWPGAKKLRLMYILNADADASSGVTITHLSLNGFVP